MSKVIDLHGMFSTVVYVDDISQLVVGAVRFVARFLACAVVSSVAAARALKLYIVDPGNGETKSTFVASHFAIVAEVVLALKAFGMAMSHTHTHLLETRACCFLSTGLAA